RGAPSTTARNVKQPAVDHLSGTDSGPEQLVDMIQFFAWKWFYVKSSGNLYSQ
ncbi:hypothetical protein A2U01_0055805, partial [Trifolium medium]|nr:hypothetical protein [Trifolium medium]